MAIGALAPPSSASSLSRTRTCAVNVPVWEQLIVGSCERGFEIEQPSGAMVHE